MKRDMGFQGMNKKLNKNFVEINLYLIFGVLTTIINIAVYEVLCYVNMDYKLSNTIAFIVAVIFAYVTNKLIVFKKRSENFKALLYEGFKFFTSRIFTYVIELMMLMVLVDFISFNKSISKWIVTIIVVILNYFLSKKKVFVDKGSR